MLTWFRKFYCHSRLVRIKSSPKSMSCRIDSRNRPNFNSILDNKQITLLPLFGCFSKKKTFNDFFGRAERGLFAQGHIKMFFPVRDIHMCFISWNLFFSALFGRTYPIFVKALRRVHNLSYTKFLASEDFFPRVSAKNFNFLEGKGYIFESCLYNKLGNANVFELIDGW